jgi:hypothetical protein
MDARSAPGRILGHHPENQILQFFTDSLSTHNDSMAGKPIPVQSEASAMPTKQQFPALRLPRRVSISATAVGQQPRTVYQCEQAWVLASCAATPRAVGEGPDFPAGGHVESGGSVETDPTGARAWQIYNKAARVLALWKLLKSRQIRILARHNYHQERNHQGKDNLLLFPLPLQPLRRKQGKLRCRERLGGLLKYYEREAA